MSIPNPYSTQPVPGAVVEATAPVSPFSSDPWFGSDYSYRQADIAHMTTAAIEKFFPCPGIIPDYDSHPSASYQYSGSQPAPVPPIGYPQPQLHRISGEYVHPPQRLPIPGEYVHLPPQPPHLRIPGWQPQGSPSYLLMEPQGNPSAGYPNPLKPQNKTLESQCTMRKMPDKERRYLSQDEKQQLIADIQQLPAKVFKKDIQILIDKYDVCASTIQNFRTLHRKGGLNPSPGTGHPEPPQPQILAGQSAKCGKKPAKERKNLSNRERRQLIEEIRQQPPRAPIGANKELMDKYGIGLSTLSRYRQRFRNRRSKTATPHEHLTPY